ncbi:hypothetical protein ES319_A06G163500v1 [Gossypium barbadense]|uniref:Uncharacterized protein n=2 Tax=Gossypium TaxID=3633 RepID=A0A5J5VF73_GOSBA|nr:hypothetical protein ES319_A06G163500v1 [Gossypium barbadense]TYH14013.1 hypothetical protein ES288_A06G184900v1 [Gossypium darwinii]
MRNKKMNPFPVALPNPHQNPYRFLGARMLAILDRGEEGSTSIREEVNEVEVTILVQDAKNGGLRATSVLT